jgi:hypothetical protein
MGKPAEGVIKDKRADQGELRGSGLRGGRLLSTVDFPSVDLLALKLRELLGEKLSWCKLP